MDSWTLTFNMYFFTSTYSGPLGMWRPRCLLPWKASSLQFASARIHHFQLQDYITSSITRILFSPRHQFANLLFKVMECWMVETITQYYFPHLDCLAWIKTDSQDQWHPCCWSKGFCADIDRSSGEESRLQRLRCCNPKNLLATIKRLVQWTVSRDHF